MTDPTPDNVHVLFPRVPGPGSALEPKIFEAEIVDDDDFDASEYAHEEGPSISPGAELVPADPGRRQRLPRVRPAAGTAVGHAYTTAAGVGSWAGRAWDGATLGAYRRQIRAAEGTGDAVALAEWTARREEAVARRRERLVAAPQLVSSIIAAGVLGVLGLIVVVAILGGLAEAAHVASFFDVVGGALFLGGLLLRVALAALVVAVVGGPVLLLVLAWREGRRSGVAPGWVATTSDADVDVEIDETTIAEALKALRIPGIRDYFKRGAPLQFIVPARTDGRGTHAVVRLPLGVRAEVISRRRGDLAAGLFRLEKEVWPTTGAEAAILDLWIADKGALAEGAGPYPLLTEGAVDVFKGVPGGKTLRGDEITVPVMERNTLTGGMPGQGKSSSARIIMLGAALDPTAELRIYVPDYNYDFEVFRPRCSRYVMGADDEHVAAILADLQQLYAEVQHRGQLLIEHETPAVTRKLASAGVGLHPLFVLLEEAHLCIQHKEHGAAISDLLVNIVKLGRKRGIHIVVSTQAPTKDSMPRDVTRNCSNGIAFAVGDHVANDALLGQGAYKAGHRATELIPGTDVGTAVVKGVVGESRSAIMQFYFVDVARGSDQVSPIIARSLEAIRAAGRTLPRSGPTEQRDLLVDVAAVLETEPIPAAEVAVLVRRRAPSWAPYRALDGKTLRERLAGGYGVKVPSTANRWLVHPETVRAALASREAADADG